MLIPITPEARGMISCNQIQAGHESFRISSAQCPPNRRRFRRCNVGRHYPSFLMQATTLPMTAYGQAFLTCEGRQLAGQVRPCRAAYAGFTRSVPTAKRSPECERSQCRASRSLRRGHRNRARSFQVDPMRPDATGRSRATKSRTFLLASIGAVTGFLRRRYSDGSSRCCRRRCTHCRIEPMMCNM